MKPTSSNRECGIRKPFCVAACLIPFTITRIAIVSVLFLGILLIWPSGLSHARTVEKVHPANPVVAPSTLLKSIVVGNYQPYTFVNDKGIPDGFSVDVAKAVTRVMALQLEIRVDTWAHATEALSNGTIDFLPMMAYSPERDKTFDFSAPHTIAYDAVFSRIGSQKIRSLKDLTEKTVIVMNKDAAHQYLSSSGLTAKMKLILVDSLPDALRTLADGKGDTALMPKLVGLMIIKKLNLTNLDTSPVVIDAYNRPFSFAVKDGNQALLERLGQGLSIIKSTGQYQEIYNKWFGALEPPGLPRGTVIKYLGIIVAAFILAVLVLILWNVSLRKKVASRTKHLTAEVQERKRSEEALHESRERFMTMFEQAPLGIAMMDSHTGHIYEVNRKFAEICGRTIEEMAKIDWMSITHPDDVQEDLDNMALLNAGKIKGFDMRKRYFRPDGSIVWIHMTIAPIEWENQIHLRHLCMIEDITGHIRAEEQIKQISRFPSENPNPVMRISAEGVMEYANAAANDVLSVMGFEIGRQINAEWQARISRFVVYQDGPHPNRPDPGQHVHQCP